MEEIEGWDLRGEVRGGIVGAAGPLRRGSVCHGSRAVKWEIVFVIVESGRNVGT